MSSKAPEFGPNDWFVQERYEEFLADPESVDPIWREYFGTNGVGVADSTSSTVNGDTVSTSTGTSAIGASRPPPSPPIRAASNGRPATITTGKPGAVQHRAILPPAPHHAVPGPRADGNESTDASPPAARPTRPATTARPGDIVAAKTAKAAHDARGGGMTTTPLRGDAAMVVKNMTSSLEVPTATSVRAVPAKLMADNRIVINNFLTRNRGGKVSFTHLIGYAIVRAIGDFPKTRQSPTSAGSRGAREPGSADIPGARAAGDDPRTHRYQAGFSSSEGSTIGRVRPGARGRAGRGDHRGLRNTHAEAGVSAADLLALLRPCSGSVSPNAEGLFSILVARFYGR